MTSGTPLIFPGFRCAPLVSLPYGMHNRYMSSRPNPQDFSHSTEYESYGFNVSDSSSSSNGSTPMHPLPSSQQTPQQLSQGTDYTRDSHIQSSHEQDSYTQPAYTQSSSTQLPHTQPPYAQSSDFFADATASSAAQAQGAPLQEVPPLAPARYPLVRPYQNRIFAGVCQGLSIHLGVKAWIVRLIFAITAFTGIGIIAYLLLWILVPSAAIVTEDVSLNAQQAPLSRGNSSFTTTEFIDTTGAHASVPLPSSQTINSQQTVEKFGGTLGSAFAPSVYAPGSYATDATDPSSTAANPYTSRNSWNFIGMGILSLAVIFLIYHMLITNDEVTPIIAVEITLAAICALGVWMYFERFSQGHPIVTVAALGVFVVGMLGAFFILFRRPVAIQIFGIFVIGIISTAVMVAPWLALSHQKLATETAQKEREEERADMAAHLHDSVLQTLNLIQQNAGNSAMVAQLAHTQERELRRWLYEEREDAIDSLAGSMKLISAHVEDTFGVPIDVITVGDTQPTEHTNALLEATQQALTNASTHGKPAISLYVECGSAQIQVFVRDHGDGFDVADIPADRMGIRHSIIGRVERAGGTVKIVSRPQWGTEVRMTLPVVNATNA